MQNIFNKEKKEKERTDSKEHKIKA